MEKDNEKLEISFEIKKCDTDDDEEDEEERESGMTLTEVVRLMEFLKEDGYTLDQILDLLKHISGEE